MIEQLMKPSDSGFEVNGLVLCVQMLSRETHMASYLMGQSCNTPRASSDSPTQIYSRPLPLKLPALSHGRRTCVDMPFVYAGKSTRAPCDLERRAWFR